MIHDKSIAAKNCNRAHLKINVTKLYFIIFFEVNTTYTSLAPSTHNSVYIIFILHQLELVFFWKPINFLFSKLGLLDLHNFTN